MASNIGPCRYPTRDGIAIPVWDLDLPASRYGDSERHRNNHHAHFSERRFGRLAVTQCLRDLDRHQYVMPVDIHNWIHDTYAPPEFPSEEQAAREVIDAYEKGEMFKRYDKGTHSYQCHEIPEEVVNRLMAKYALYSVFSMAAD